MGNQRALFKKKFTRRDLFRYGIRISILAFLGIGFTGRNDLTVERHILKYKNLPEPFNGFRVVQISDLHASFWVGRNYLDRVVDRIGAPPEITSIQLQSG